MENKEDSEYINKIIIFMIDYLMNRLNGKKIDIFNQDYKQIKEINYGFDFFDNNMNFYSELYQVLKILPTYPNLLENVKPIINQRNLLIFLKYLKKIIIEHKDAYKNPVIKLNLKLIISYFVKQKGQKIINSSEYFYICQKEIEKIYETKNDELKTDFDNKWINNFEEEIKSFKTLQLDNLIIAFQRVKDYYIKNEDYNNCDEVYKIVNKLLKETKDIENEIINNDKYKEYISLYLKITTKENGYDEKHKEYKIKMEQIKKSTFYFKDIFEIDLNNMNDILCFLSVLPSYSSYKKFNGINDLYIEFKNNYELLLKESKEDLTEDLNRIIKSQEFYEKMKKIFESKSVKDYLSNKRKFMDDYNVSIVNNSLDDYDDDLSNGYNQFLSFIKKDKNWFNSLFIFKYLPKNKRAFVDLNMKIVLNPLFIELSDSLNDDKNKKEKILEAYLIIILIHEIAHLLKFMKETNLSLDIPQTPKNKEDGEIFIKFLFGIPVIKTITYLEAKEINNCDNWENIDKLHKIFQKENKEEKNKEEENQNNLYKINYYLSDINDDEENNDSDEDDHWYDIN